MLDEKTSNRLLNTTTKYNKEKDNIDNFTINILKRKLEKVKEKNRRLKQRIKYMEKDFEVKSSLLEKKVIKYDEEINNIKTYKEQIEKAINEVSECDNCKKYTIEIFNLTSSSLSP